MKFKVGDKVRVREDLKVWETYEPITLLSGEMADARGNVYRVLESHSPGVYILSNKFLYTEEMLEPIEDPLADKIQERNNKQSIQDRLPEELEKLLADAPYDPIKPTHYRKGEIDLYESWYLTYPFNEFRAGMQMIAERYMKRDKDNRIQDLNKAIYTLERLKEYEEVQHERATDSQR